MTKQQILVVAPSGWDEQRLAAWDCYGLVFTYVKEYPADGMSAWRSGRTPGCETIEVAAHCHAYSGGFGQHALNRLFSQALLACRPKAVVIVGLSGCTVDLPRVAALLGVPALLILDKPAQPPESLSETTRRWLESSLASCTHILPAHQEFDQCWPASWLDSEAVADAGELSVLLDRLVQQPGSAYCYDYSIYEFCQRDHPLLVNMQRGDTTHFAGCSRVLDLGCGVGIFLDCLRQQGIDAKGVECDSRVAEYARGMGLNVVTGDALEYLENTDASYDGIYCSHFVEHLPIDAVQQLLQLMAERVTVGGVLVLVFPDPESIRSQLLGFWRDPEHVRFYHPELVISMAATVGLELEWSSYEVQPHRVVPFAEAPPPVSPAAPFSPLPLGPENDQYGPIECLLQKFGLVTERRLRRLEERLLQWSDLLHNESLGYVAASAQLEQRTDTLWDVNQTWAWNDNVTLRLRKGVG